MMFDLLDFILRLSSCSSAIADDPAAFSDEEGLKEVVFIVTIFHHKVSNGIWSISEETQGQLQVLIDWIGGRIL